MKQFTICKNESVSTLQCLNPTPLKQNTVELSKQGAAAFNDPFNFNFSSLQLKTKRPNTGTTNKKKYPREFFDDNVRLRVRACVSDLRARLQRPSDPRGRSAGTRKDLGNARDKARSARCLRKLAPSTGSVATGASPLWRRTFILDKSDGEEETAERPPSPASLTRRLLRPRGIHSACRYVTLHRYGVTASPLFPLERRPELARFHRPPPPPPMCHAAPPRKV